MVHNFLIDIFKEIIENKDTRGIDFSKIDSDLISEQDLELIKKFNEMYKLIENEKSRQSGFFNMGPVVVFECEHTEDDKIIIDYMSPNISQFGYDSNELVNSGSEYSTIIYEEDKHAARNLLVSKINSGESVIEQDYRIITSTGEFKWVYDYTIIKKDKKGNPEKYYGYIVDITKRKEIEARMLKSEERYALAVKGANEGIWDWNIKENTFFCSDRCKEIMEFDFDENLTPKQIRDKLIYEEDKERVYKAIRDHLNRKTPYYKAEYRVNTKYGKKWILDRGQAIWNTGGIPVRMAGSFTDISDRKQVEEKLQYISLHDEATGLYNRMYFKEEMKRFNNDRYLPVSIIVCDMNGLKVVNDTMGHQMGDLFICTAASIVKSCFREGDVVARIGGDEIAAFMPNTEENVASDICARIKNKLARYREDNPSIPVTLAIGYAVRRDNSRTMESVFSEADDNMYREKERDRESVRSMILDMLVNKASQVDGTRSEHMHRVENMAEGIAKVMKLSNEKIRNVKLAAKYHDIGLVGINNCDITNINFTIKEYAEIHRHSEIGARIAKMHPLLKDVSEIILQHHEWWNGSGYPNGKKGKEILIEARVISVADVFDFITSGSNDVDIKEKAVKEIMGRSGTQFDPEVVEAFTKYI